MPGLKGGKKAVASNISEFHKGPTYKKTKARHGKKVADKQAVAVGFAESRRKKRKAKKRANRSENEQ
jgi:hypothetical protein